MQKTIAIKSSLNSGDLVANLAGLQHIYQTTGLKSVICQRLDMPIFYFEGAKHPVVNDKGEQVSMSRKQWDMLSPLLLAQEYIDHVQEYEGQKWDFNLDKSSEEGLRIKPYGNLHYWNSLYNPQLIWDLSIPWLKVYERDIRYADKIIINRTERYLNPYIEYFFLKEYQHNLFFAGTRDEHEIFCKEWKLQIPYLEVKDFLELTIALHSCKFVLCNQSMVFHICDAIKKERVLEVSQHFPNTWPTGYGGYPFIFQEALQFLFQKLYNEL